MVLSLIFLQLGWFKMYQVERAPTRWQQSLDLILFKTLAQETQTGALYQPREVDGEENRREFQKGGDICITMTDSR